MAFTATEDLTQMWAAQTVYEARQDFLMINLFSGDQVDGWVNGAYEVHVPDPEWATGVTAQSRTRDQDWTAATELSPSDITFSTSIRYEESNLVKYEDAVENSWNAVERLRSRQAYQIGAAIDSAIYEAVKTGIVAADKTTLGSAGSVFIPRVAPYKPTGMGAAGLILDALDAYSSKLARADAFTSASDGAMADAWAVLPPELFTANRRAMLELGLAFDANTRNALAQSFGGGVARRYVGEYAGVTVFSAGYEAIPVNNEDWVFVCGCRAASVAAIRLPLVQYFDASVNPNSTPGTLLRQRGFGGYAELAGGLLHEFTIHAE